jgi:hypothetical protein
MRGVRNAPRWLTPSQRDPLLVRAHAARAAGAGNSLLWQVNPRKGETLRSLSPAFRAARYLLRSGRVHWPIRRVVSPPPPVLRVVPVAAAATAGTAPRRTRWEARAAQGRRLEPPAVQWGLPVRRRRVRYVGGERVSRCQFDSLRYY